MYIHPVLCDVTLFFIKRYFMNTIPSIKFNIEDLYPCYDCPLGFEYCEMCPCFGQKYVLIANVRDYVTPSYL